MNIAMGDTSLLRFIYLTVTLIFRAYRKAKGAVNLEDPVSPSKVSHFTENIY